MPQTERAVGRSLTLNGTSLWHRRLLCHQKRRRCVRRPRNVGITTEWLNHRLHRPRAAACDWKSSTATGEVAVCRARREESPLLLMPLCVCCFQRSRCEQSSRCPVMP